MKQLEKIVEETSHALEILAEKTESLLTQYWDEHIALNKPLPLTEKSVLGCRTRRVSGGLYIQWYWNTWRKVESDGKKKSKPYSNHISIGRKGGHSYSDATLLKHAKDWEKERVLHYEEQFALIRKAAHLIVHTRKYARDAIKAIEALEEKSTAVGSETP